MSNFKCNQVTRTVTMNLPEEITLREKVRNDFSVLFNDKTGETRIQTNERQSMPVALLKMDFSKTDFMSRAAADELLCQATRLSCRTVCENLRDDLRRMLEVVSRKHPSNKIHIS